tara:strand:+ start:183991 stop:185772 length:1782 start_codon:yes stop_codon:yes gene_type:complete
MGNWQLKDFLSAQKWQLDYLFDLAVQGWFVHLGVFLATTIMLVSALPDHEWPLIWGASMGFLTFSHIFLAFSYKRRNAQNRASVPVFAGFHSGLTALVGLCWGAGAFGASSGGFEVLLIYSLALGGTALGAVSSQHVFPRSCMVSLWTSIPLLATAHIFSGEGASGWAVFAMVFLYAGILSILSLRMLRFMRTNVALTRSLDSRLSELTELTGELEAARHEADMANLSKSRLLAHASHDLRQPAHAIGLFTACLRDMNLAPDALQHVDSIDQAARSVSRLLGSLLDLSRLDVGGIAPKFEPVDIDHLLAEIVGQHHDSIRAAGNSVDITPSGLWVSADASLLGAMVQNIFSNALKYAPTVPLRLFAYRSGDDEIAIQISDLGPGIEAKDLANIFDEFYRANTDSAGRVEGLGLGLSIVKRLADLMSLRVEVSSEVGNGTTVTISGLREVAGGERAPSRSLRQHPLTGLRVCLIDDDNDVLEASAALLRRWGCEVFVSREVPLTARGCDVIVSDFDLGLSGDGLEAIAAIRALEGWAVPAAILSGRSEPEILRRIDAAGIPFLSKPLHPVELRALLTSIALDAGEAASVSEGKG